MAHIARQTPPVTSPPAGRPQIIPHLPYERGLEAVAWLERAFGFREIESARHESPGSLHTELEIGSGRIYEQAVAAGARICAEPEDKFYGDRVYEAYDLEGQRWSFHRHTGRTFPIGEPPPRRDEDRD